MKAKKVKPGKPETQALQVPDKSAEPTLSEKVAAEITRRRLNGEKIDYYPQILSDL